MATFHFELVSPEQLLFSGEVTQVDVPGEAGDFGVLAGHAPYIATLKPGVLMIFGAGAPQRIVVRGGFAEAGPTGLIVLAEEATPVAEIDVAELDQAIKDTEEDIADAENDPARDKARSRLEQLRRLKSMLGS
jgi:F-type H+-transporting ATPase subunit epsilon